MQLETALGVADRADAEEVEVRVEEAHEEVAQERSLRGG